LFHDIGHNFSYSLQFDGLEDSFFSSGEEGSSHIHAREGKSFVFHMAFCFVAHATFKVYVMNGMEGAT
jgi:hypothetical protein